MRSRRLGRGTAFSPLEPTYNAQLVNRLHTVLPAIRSRSGASYGCVVLCTSCSGLCRRRCANSAARCLRSAGQSARRSPRPISSLSAKPPRLPQKTGTRTVLQARQPCALSQANKHIEAGITMGRPISRPRSNPRRRISTLQPQNRGGRREPMKRRAAALILSLERIDFSVFPFSL
jgi:hypothetical protein